jgi:hypothetical protein
LENNLPISYRYLSETGVVDTTVTGVVQTSDLMEYFNKLLDDPSIKPGFVEIFDMEGIEDFVVHYRETPAFRYIWERYLEKGCRATIVVAPTALAFGTARMVQAVIQPGREGPRGHFSVVRTRTEIQQKLACLPAWDRAPRDSPPA